MAISTSAALSQLAKMQKTTKLAKARVLAARETSEERMEYLYNSGLRFASATAAGYADARVDDTLAGLTPSELGGLTIGAMSMTGILGKATKSARSVSEGALCGALYRRAFVFGGGAEVAAPGELTPGAPVGQAIGPTEEHDILVALQQEQATALADAEELID